MKKVLFLALSFSLVFGFVSLAVSGDRTTRRPNIVVILADDLGYGDPGCYNKESLIPTPNIDRLATQGMRFTDAHSPSAVCSPTRYGLPGSRHQTPLELLRRA